MNVAMLCCHVRRKAGWRRDVAKRIWCTGFVSDLQLLAQSCVKKMVHSDWKWHLKWWVFPVEHGDFPVRYVRLPDGTVMGYDMLWYASYSFQECFCITSQCRPCLHRIASSKTFAWHAVLKKCSCSHYEVLGSPWCLIDLSMQLLTLDGNVGILHHIYSQCLLSSENVWGPYLLQDNEEKIRRWHEKIHVMKWNEIKIKDMKCGKKSSDEVKWHEVQSVKCLCDVLKCKGETRDACEM